MYPEVHEKGEERGKPTYLEGSVVAQLVLFIVCLKNADRINETFIVNIPHCPGRIPNVQNKPKNPPTTVSHACVPPTS
jgi:hypothetical protein